MIKERFESICDYLSTILIGTEFYNHVFAVGGSVRDYMMNKKIKDIDLVVDMQEGGIRLANWLFDHKHLLYEPVVYPTYGTCQFRLLKFQEYELEAVHTRGEQYHDKNSRNPETCFANITEDAFRRDLTINALYYNIFTKKVVDPTEMGLNDIINKVIRTTNKNPDIVFDDDPLRILRVIRFSSRLNWNIEQNTLDAMRRFSHRLKIISRERITAELVNMLEHDNFDSAMSIIYRLGLWKDVTMTEILTSSEFTKRIIRPLQHCEGDIVSKLAVIYSGKNSKYVYDILHDMKFDNKTASVVSKIVGHINDIHIGITEYDLRKIQLCFPDYTQYNEYIDTVKAVYYDMTDDTRALIDDTDCIMCGYKLPVDGYDVVNVTGISRGRRIGEILDKLYDMACMNPKITKKECFIFLHSLQS